MATTRIDLGNIKGPKGDQGPQGEIGPQGPKGDTPSFEIGTDGHLYVIWG